MWLLRQFKMTGLFTCCLCGGTNPGDACICAGCDDDLPHISTACDVCGIPLLENGICGYCLRHKHLADSIISAYSYRYPLTQLIRQGKYRGEIRVLNSLTYGLAEKIQSTVQVMPEVMIPVPLHRWRVFNRGYNQSLEICRLLSRKLDIPYNPGIIYRHRSTPPMFDLSPAQRRRNIRDSFRLPEPVNYHSVAIIDDVVTSGATVNELARQLKRAGVRHVQAWSLARAY